MKNSVMLKEIKICGSIVDGLFLNDIEQVFTNISDDNVEFVYTFPIPENASISEFSALTGNNSFTGYVLHNEQALVKYKTELSKGNNVYMLESWQENIFQVPLGNLAKGEDVIINISYIQDVITKDNAFCLIIPMLASSRCTPEASIGQKKDRGNHDQNDIVPDSALITSGQEEMVCEVKTSIMLDLENHIREISSPSHSVNVEIKGSKGTVTVNSAEANSDFALNVLMDSVYSEKFVTSQSPYKEYFSYISFVPKLEKSERSNKEFIFLIDVSRYMSGKNLHLAIKALKTCLRSMEAGDVFNIIAFESSLECFSDRSVKFNEASLIKAEMWLDGLTSCGDIELFNAIKCAVESTNKDSDCIIMLITSGNIGNEDKITRYVKSSYSGRVFCVGIDVNANYSFLNRISTIGNGFAEFYYTASNEDLFNKIIRQFARSNSSYLKDIRLESTANRISAVIPSKYIYDNEYCGIIIKTDKAIDSVSIVGMNGEKAVRFDLRVSDTGGNVALLKKMWGKERLAQQELRFYDKLQRHEEIVLKRYIWDICNYVGVVCRHTSFVVENNHGKKSSHLPEGSSATREDWLYFLSQSWEKPSMIALISNAYAESNVEKYFGSNLNG